MPGYLPVALPSAWLRVPPATFAATQGIYFSMRTSYVPPAIPALVAMLLLQPVGGHAHDTTVPISIAKFILKAKKDKRRFVFRVKNEDRLRIQAHDPMVENSFLLVRGTGANAGGTGLIALDRQHWSRIEKKGAIKGYKYSFFSKACG